MIRPAIKPSELGVHFDPRLAAKLGSLSNLHAISELLQEWKVIDTDGQITNQDHWFFDRDKPNRPVWDRSVSYALHAHLQPLGHVTQAAWGEPADDQTFTPYQRTSDKIAAYSLKDSEPSAGFLLFDVVDDPSGHGFRPALTPQVH